MKRFVFLLVMLSFSITFVHAQQENPQIEFENEAEHMATYKEYGGFILDLTETLARPMALPEVKLLNQSVDPFINWLERLHFDLGKVYYGKSNPSIFDSNRSRAYHYGTSSYSGINQPLNTASFRLNQNWRLNTEGDYDTDGYKRKIPSALPWEQNDFRGAFELKSSKGFSVRFEVQRKASPYGAW